MNEEIDKADDVREQLELAFKEEAEVQPSDGYCVWYLGKMAEADALEAKVKVQFEKIVKEIKRRREGLQRVCGAEFRQRIDAMVEAGPRKKDGTLRKKSVNLLTGTAGYRATKDKIVFTDEDKAHVFSVENHLNAAVVTTRLNKTPFLKHFKETGELPDGCEFVAAEDKFYPAVSGMQLPERTDHE